VKYETAAAFRQALLTQLRTLAEDSGIPPEHLRKRVVFERLLARLLMVAPARWALKGGLALDLWLKSRARTTKDADLVGPSGTEQATEDLLSAQGLDLGDQFSFRVTQSRESGVEEPEPTVRFHVTAEVAGSVFDEAVIDVAITQEIDWEPETVSSNLLAFAGIPEVTIPVVPIEIQVAEKIHAYTRPYGRQQRPTTRVKDLVDLVVIVEARSLDGRRLRAALERTFARRGTHPIPETLPAPPRQWAVSFGALAAQAKVAPVLAKGFDRVLSCLRPILQGMAAGRWDPSSGVWKAESSEHS
jgi:hypothetical protein